MDMTMRGGAALLPMAFLPWWALPTSELSSYRTSCSLLVNARPRR